MSDRKSVVLPAALALVLLGAYVGAYYTMVVPDKLARPYFRARSYASFTERARLFFTPIHWFDRHIIRREYWEWGP